ncbi:Gfo/Idh/MocA family oxidoreductase [Patescibacteria group bacterium]|nr:Gfo/Idh/MocA family oxidoreductase [Patescibacteria group bacterium]MBU1448568.1 Gfo/Idh/MocA family oxidoreductase [Patescibacteria group bacterium]MBU2613202.1 Gfo/Idh/MocA family oxidoreductase [Patescibacteria group bacterium]
MKVLVVGTGYWGPNIVRNLVEFSEVECIGVSDLDRAKAEKMVARFPRTRLAGPAPEAFGEGYDAAVIVTPVDSHAPLAEAALRAGLHVLVEKPLTRTSADAERLIALAEEKNRRLMVGHVFHYKPEVRELVRLVESGELGNVRYMDSVRVNLGLFRSDVNVMWDLAPHDLSIFEAIMKRMPERVSAIGACHVHHPTTPQETMVLMTLDYGDGCLGHVHVNWFSPLKQRTMVIAGDRKMAVYDDINPTHPIKVYDRGTYDPATDTPMYPALRTGETVSPHVKQEEPLRIQLREFFGAIAEGRAPATDGAAGLRVVKLLEAGMRSLAEDGRFVNVA